MLRIQSVLCMSLFISSPGVLGVEFHFDCELRDGSSDNPEHGQLVLIANVERLPTEAELLQEFGDIYHLYETGLQGPFLRRGEIFTRFGNRQTPSSWTVKKVTRYQALLYYWGRKHGHSFEFRRGTFPSPGSGQGCSGSAGSFVGGPSGARGTCIPETPPAVGGPRAQSNFRGISDTPFGVCRGGGNSVAGSSASGGVGSSGGTSIQETPPAVGGPRAPQNFRGVSDTPHGCGGGSGGAKPQVQHGWKSPVTEVNKGPAAVAHQTAQQAESQPLVQQLAPVQTGAQLGLPRQMPEPLAREFATIYRQSVCIQQLKYDQSCLVQTICSAMGLPDPLTAAQDAVELALAHWCSMALRMSKSSEGASLEKVLSNFEAQLMETVTEEEQEVEMAVQAEAAEAGEAAAAAAAAAEESVAAGEEAEAELLEYEVETLASELTGERQFGYSQSLLQAAVLPNAPVAPAAVPPVAPPIVTVAHAALAGVSHASRKRPMGQQGQASMSDEEQMRIALQKSRGPDQRRLAEEWLYGKGSGGAVSGGAGSGGAGSSGDPTIPANSAVAPKAAPVLIPPALGALPAVRPMVQSAGRTEVNKPKPIVKSEAEEDEERLRPGISYGNGVLPPPPADPYVFFIHGHRRVEATSFPTTTYSFTHNMLIQWAFMQHGLPTPETVMGYAPIQQVLQGVQAYLNSYGQHQIWAAFEALVATVQPYQVQTLMNQHGGALPTYLEDFEQEQVMDSWGLETQLAQIQHQLDTAFAQGPSVWPPGVGVTEEAPCMSGLSTEDRQGYMRIGQARQRICSSNPRDVVTGLLSLRDFGVLDPSLSDALGPPGQAIPASDLESLMEDLGYMSTLRIGPLSHERHWEQCLKTLRAFLVDHKTYVWSAQGRQHQRHLLLEPDWVRFQLVFNPRSTQQTVRVIGPGAAELGTLLAENYPDSERNPIGRQNDLEGLRRQGFRSISVQHDLTKDKDDEGPGLFDGLEPGTEAPLAPAMYALRRLLLTLPLVEVLILRASRLSHAQKLKAARAAVAQQAMQQAQANGGSNFGTLGGGRGGQGGGGLGGRGGGGGGGGGFRPPRAIGTNPHPFQGPGA